MIQFMHLDLQLPKFFWKGEIRGGKKSMDFKKRTMRFVTPEIKKKSQEKLKE